MARTKKATTPEEREREKDRRLQHKYNITLAGRNQLAVEQNFKCKICGGPLDQFGPCCVDHYHFKVRASLEIHPYSKDVKWLAQTYNEQGNIVDVRHAKTKAVAISDAKRAGLKWAIRGLLCVKCNYGLGCVERFFDAAAHPENLDPVRTYLSNRLYHPNSLDTKPVL
jgi:hypothetical protein